jgi:methyl-accepting chemotaxis protein
MGKQLAGALQETEKGVTAVVQRINAVHGLSCGQVDRLGQTMEQCLVLVDVTRQQANQNRKVITIVRQEMDSHFDELRLSVERTQNLSREVRELKAFVELITDIAGQTKLLAVNAAIQATHAGKAGAAFGVVASEVKALSVRSALAAKEIADKTGDLSRRMTAELAATEKSAEVVRASASHLKAIILDIEALESRFNGASTALRGILGEVQVSNGDVVTQLTEALGHIQFQDVVRQRVEQVEQVLGELTAHTRIMIKKISEDGWDGIFALPLKERLDQQVKHYVMNSQRDSHSAALGGPIAGGGNGPAIELF